MMVVEPSRLAIQLGLDTSIGLHAMPIDTQMDLSTLASRLPTDIRQAVAKRQREFLAGRYCAARALAHAGYLGEGWLPLGEDRLPVWPAGWIGSISHSHFCAVAVATLSTSCRALGVDMEPLVNTAVAADIESSVACRDELELLDNLPRESRVTLLFSAKEALFKALYPQARRFHDFKAARLQGIDGNGLRLQLSKPWGDHLPEGFEVTVRFAVCDGHVYSLARLP
jgi:enterobactin synthetase component D